MTHQSSDEVRIDFLEAIQIMDSGSDPHFDFITRLTSELLEVPIALISLVGEKRQWFKSACGTDVKETALEYSVCNLAIRQSDVFIIEDLTQHPHFKNFPLYFGERLATYYAGVPLKNSMGVAYGTLCVLDFKKRSFDEKQLERLQEFAGQAQILIDNLEKRVQLEHEAKVKEEIIVQNLDAYIEVSLPLSGLSELNFNEIFDANEPSNGKLRHDLGIEIDLFSQAVAEKYRELRHEEIAKAIRNHDQSYSIEYCLHTSEKSRKYLLEKGSILYKSTNAVLKISFIDISESHFKNTLYKNIFENTQALMYTHDLSGKILEVNPAALDIVGYREDEIVGKDLFYFTPKEQHYLVKSYLETISEKLTFKGRTKIYHRDGWPIYMDVQYQLIEGPTNSMVICHSIDKTDFVKKKAEIKALTKLLNDAQRIARIGGWEMDIDTGKTEWTDQVYQIHEVDFDYDHNKENGIKFYHPDDQKIIIEAIENTIKTGEPYDVICRFITAKSNQLWVRATGELIERKGKLKLVGIFQDITIRQEAILELQNTKKRLQSVFDQIDDVIWSVSYPDFQLVECTPSVEKVYGISLKQWVEDPSLWIKMIHPEDKEIIEDIYKDIEEMGSYEADYRIIDAHGKIKWIENRGHVVEIDGRKERVDGIIRDITDRKQAEIQHDYQRSILSSLFELSPIGLALNDFETGRFLRVNDKLLEPTGYSRSELLEKEYFDITPKEYKPQEDAAIEAMLSTGKYPTFRKKYIRKDGSRYPVELRGVLVEDPNGKKLIWSYIEDISERLAAEQKLNESLARMSGILNASEEVIILGVGADLKIHTFNTGASRLLGLKKDQVVNQKSINDFDFQFQDNRDKALSLVDRVDQTEQGPPVRATVLSRKGNEIPLLLKMAKIQSTQEEADGFVIVAMDITNILKAEQELRLVLQLTESKNDRLKNFARIVSHNLRSHSGNIHSLLELMVTENADLADHELYQMIMKASDNLSETIENLTEVAKVNTGDEGELSVLDLEPILIKAIDSLTGKAAQANVNIQLDTDDLHRVMGITAYIDSICLNFISNAIKYVDYSKDSHLIIRVSREGDCVRIDFEDNGIGIDMQRYGEQLFGMYKTFTSRQDSRGVGLFITKNQIESLGGRVEVSSELGKGTTFSVFLQSAD
ncbi:MAG: PAS domain S-box protein [Cyclobacteriaceae bacterium]|nr:PAS domain S-box protein [Cyclobacteriaceae bacterium]MCH8516378.1 PAS domain S-box protein [Cyclobacteriaceae bacterium]